MSIANICAQFSCDRSGYPPIGRAAIWTLYFVILIDFFQLTFVFPFIPALVNDFGGTPEVVAAQVAVLSSVAAFTEMIANPVLGSISDKFGRRRVMLASTFGSAISAALLGYSKNFPMVIAARVINSMSGGTAAVANTFMADVTSPDERPDYMAKITSLIGAGIAVGPVAGGFLFKLGGIEFACLSAGAVSLTNFVCVLFFLPETSPNLRGPRLAGNASAEGGSDSAAHSEAVPAAGTEPTSQPKLPCMIWFLFSANLFLSPMSVIFDTFANLYVTKQFYEGDGQQGTTLFSQCMACIGICLVVVPLVLYQPCKRCVGFNGTIVLGTIFVVTGLIGNGIALKPIVFLVGTMCWASGFQILGPAIPVLITSLSPPSAYGRAFGLFMSFGNASRVLGPALFTPIYNFEEKLIFFVMAGSIVVMAVILLVVSALVSKASPAADNNAGISTATAINPTADGEGEPPQFLRQLSNQTRGQMMHFEDVSPFNRRANAAPRPLERAQTDGEQVSRRKALLSVAADDPREMKRAFTECWA